MATRARLFASFLCFSVMNRRRVGQLDMITAYTNCPTHDAVGNACIQLRIDFRCAARTPEKGDAAAVATYGVVLPNADDTQRC